MRERKTSVLTRAADIATLVIAASAVGLLVGRMVASPTSVAQSGRPQSTEPLGEVSAIGVAGPVTDALDSRGTAEATGILVLIFRTDCRFCAAQKPGWSRLAQSAQDRGIRVIGFTNEPFSSGVATYLEDVGTGIEVFSALQPAALAEIFGSNAVPTTIVLDVERRPRLQQVGVLSGEDLDKFRDQLSRLAGERS